MINDCMVYLNEELERLRGISVKLRKNLINERKENLRVSYSHGKIQYYVKQEGEKGPGKYLRKKDLNIAKKIAQRDYDKALEKEVTERIVKINRVLDVCLMPDLIHVYDELPIARKQLVEPRIVSDDMYARMWEEAEYKGKSFDETSAKLYTEKGHLVRSKSEKIIADKLYNLQIPYRYEEPLNLKGFGLVYPDFKVLNKRKQKEVYWEHFGRMNDTDYAEKAIRKLNTYIKNGFYPGENLILTFETSECPLDMKVIEKIVREYFI